jgi:hypothetical protein
VYTQLGLEKKMTQERLTEIKQMLEAWNETDANAGDAEKTTVIGELLAELTGPTASKSIETPAVADPVLQS